MPNDKHYLAAIDLGGSKVAGLIASIEGRVISRRQEALRKDIGSFVPRTDPPVSDKPSGVSWYGPALQIEQMIKEMLQQTGISRIETIGIGSAGPLQSGGIRNPPNFEVEIPRGMTASSLFVPLNKPLEKAFSVPVTLENDCNTAVLGEAYFGVGQDAKKKNDLHIVYVTMSTGLGAGVWSGGHLLLGKHGNAAEIGHVMVKENGLRCGCGNDGCAEAYCSGQGIIQNTRIHLVNQGSTPRSPLMNLLMKDAEKAGLKESSLWRLLEFVTPKIVFMAAKEGDEIARSVVKDFIHYGGIVLSTISNAYDPTVITLGGSIAVSHPEIVEPMKQEMLLHLNVSPPEVRITPLGKKAVEYGAIVLAQKRAC